MKYKKILILIIGIFLTSGCDITYKVKFEQNKVIETNIFYLPNEKIENNDIVGTLEKMSSKYTINTDFLISPNTKILKENKVTGYSVTNEYSYDDYNTIGTCYDAFNIIKDKSNIMISTSEKFNCFDYYEELDQIKVEATVNYKVSKTNADKKKGNTYIWYINKENAENKPIQLFFDLNKKVSIWPFTNFQTYVIVIALLIVIVASIVFIVSRISKRNNKI